MSGYRKAIYGQSRNKVFVKIEPSGCSKNLIFYTTEDESAAEANINEGAGGTQNANGPSSLIIMDKDGKQDKRASQSRGTGGNNKMVGMMMSRTLDQQRNMDPIRANRKKFSTEIKLNITNYLTVSFIDSFPREIINLSVEGLQLNLTSIDNSLDYDRLLVSSNLISFIKSENVRIFPPEGSDC